MELDMTQTMLPPSQTQQGQPQYEISDADRARLERIGAAWKAYEGNLEAPLKKMDREPDDNVMSNRCQPIVDRGVDFLFGKEIEISVEENAPQEAQDVLDKIWGRKEARIPLLQKLGMNGAISGTAFLRIVPGKDGSFRLVVVDPSTVFVKTAPQDCETVLLYCIQYSTNEKQNGRPVQVFYREEITRIDPESDDTQEYEDTDAEGYDADITWQIQHWTQIGYAGMQPKTTGWTPAGQPIIWPYPFPPLFSCQNLPRPNDFWGCADITPDLIGINNSLNLVQSCINRIEKIYGGPILYAPGTGNASISIEPGKIIQLPLPENKIESVHIHSDVANALVFAENLRSDIDEQSSVPGVATGRISTMPRGNLSGIAIELLFMPLLKKTEKKECGYGKLIIDTSKALLVLNKMSGDIDITLAFQNPLPHDDLPAVQSAISKRELSISDTTLMRELGYDPEEEAALSDTEDARKMAKAQAMTAVFPPSLPGAPPLPGQPKPAPTPATAPQPAQGGQAC